MKTIWTIGHSNHSFPYFVSLLKDHGVSAVVDVRSSPYTKYTPHFSQPKIKELLNLEGIRYLSFGKEFGARREEPEAYEGNVAVWSKIKELPSFREGVERLSKGVNKGFNIALMCSEYDPGTCHRSFLVANSLVDSYEVLHIKRDGTAISHGQMLVEARNKMKLSQNATEDQVYEKAASKFQYKRR